MKMRRSLIATVLMTMLLAGAGCHEDEVAPPPPSPTFPTSPAALMAAFQDAYEAMDVAALRELLHPDFLCYLSQETIDEYALPRAYFDAQEEDLIAERMFSGEVFIRPDDEIVPGVTSIQFNFFEQETAWEEARPEDPIADAQRAQYRVDLNVVQGTNARVTIKGLIEFYLRSEQVEQGGETKDRYWMVGQVDYTTPSYYAAGEPGKRDAEDTSWGGLKACFWEETPEDRPQI